MGDGVTGESARTAGERRIGVAGLGVAGAML